MPLFHPRVVERRLKNLGPVPPKQEAILRKWADNLKAGNYDGEIQSDSEFIQRILIDVLGYSGSSAGSAWTVAKNEPVGPGNVDVALGAFTTSGERRIVAPFELKGAKTKDLDAPMAGRGKSPVQQAWEYAMDAKGAKWVLVSNFDEIRLYAVGYGRKNFERFHLSAGFDDREYYRLQLVLGADNLLGGATHDLLRESEEVEQEITSVLYRQYRDLRTHLVEEIIGNNGGVIPARAIELAQTILDRVLFVAFAEDRGLLPKGTLQQAHELKNPFSPQPSWENFKGLFTAINTGNTRLNIPGYNGGLFAESAEISSLILSDVICEGFSALGRYDYDSEVSVTILGHVFEQSISDLEEIRRSLNPAIAGADEVGSKRRTDGIFYTPPFVTRHIVENTVGRWLNDKKGELGFDEVAPLSEADHATIRIQDRGKFRGRVLSNENVKRHIDLWENYREVLSKIKVVDPACGSGAFLVEVFDYLFREGQIINRALEELNAGQSTLFRWDTHILSNNLFGVDINRESVEITKLSLWLTTANRNEKLSYLENNIQVGNSLIGDALVAGDLAFDWQEKFSSVFADGGFDIVLGNPPFVDSEAMTKAWPREREYLTRSFGCTRGNWDLYIAFLELGTKLLRKGGYFSFITPDKWLSKDFGLQIRRHILPNLISILPLGRGVFESALVDSIITTIGGGPSDTLNVLSYADGEAFIAAMVPKEGLRPEEGFDQLLSSHLAVINRIASAGCGRLVDMGETEGACATSEAYVLAEILHDAGSAFAYSAADHFKVANTGTLDRYGFRWGMRPMRYLKSDYLFPVVDRKAFERRLGATYVRRAKAPKLIVKGLTLLDAAVDSDASFVPGKTTLVVLPRRGDDLWVLAGVLNSSVASFYIKQRYSSASYNGGVSFTSDMLNNLPIPDALDSILIGNSARTAIAARSELMAITADVHGAVHASGASQIKRSLLAWYTLSPAAFVEEIGKLGVTVPVHERLQWSELLESKKAAFAAPFASWIAANSAIDDELMRAYGLSDATRKLIRSVWATT